MNNKYGLKNEELINTLYTINALNELVKEVTKYWNLIVHNNDNNKIKLHEAQLLSLDNTKVKSETSWRPKWDFEMTIKKTINWHERFLQTDDALSLCLEDMDNYFWEKKT